ncbi:MAG: cytochrome C554 and C-prime [Bacteroidetes bacterium]|nr:MAG: cytochrome C554 and C-prime [Bacteroidota bacterium]
MAGRSRGNRDLLLSLVSIAVLALTMMQCRGEKQNIRPLEDNWESAVPHQSLPQGITSLSAKQCGVCHQKHYEEWKLSTHALAWVDLQFQAELKKESSPYLCINCHIPLQNQQEYIVTGLVDGDIYQPVKIKNPRFDEELMLEGITCASCHVRNNVIIGPTGQGKSPHVVVQDTVHLSERLCISCHNAVAVVTPTLACTFETGDEWKAGPYYGEKTCLTCHMEPLQREIVAGYGERLSHLHYFKGSGIPKFDSVETKGLNGYVYYPSPVKKSYSRNEEIEYAFKVVNEEAGHKVPTGDPERFFIFSFELKNKTDSIVASKEERIGEHWEWYPIAKKLSDNNLPPREARTFNFSYKPEIKEDLTLSVNVTKHRMSAETAEYNKLGDNYPLFITVFDTVYNIAIK